MCLYALICYMLFKKALDTALARFVGNQNNAGMNLLLVHSINRVSILLITWK